MIHSKLLSETVLWRCYQKKVSLDYERCIWVQKVYEQALDYLKDVCHSFKNYTLHDATHILNVLDAMAGLLGDQIENLTICEMELLILAASIHDLGMVYTDKERNECLNDKHRFQRFLRKHCPDHLGCRPEQCPENIRQWYLRSLHPFRLSSVLQNEEWWKLFVEQPHIMASKECICAICESHGQSPEEVQANANLRYLKFNNADPLFCALLLRLADLLDFDDTRAPEVLYKYALNDKKSREEWDKHQASAGFFYLDSPSVEELAYKARCYNPGIEHAVRDFLDWIDGELNNCRKLQKHCHAEWQRNFPFPWAVSRDEIESDGYKSGDFCLTMDQEKILNLLTGEHLYENNDIFVRELLQNAIDATLLRSEMDKDFSLENARIDLWEWNDTEGNTWFRIDDHGTGMTLGMLQQYFLKVGNSYYTSLELKQDLMEHNCDKSYQGISRFGIGFLSCFLCCNYAEVSTLYFDSKKNYKEQSISQHGWIPGFGLRLEVTGLTGYYTLKSQVDQHRTSGPLCAPGFMAEIKPQLLEHNGYRVEAGTSIVIRLDPQKLRASDLREKAKDFLCGTPIPVYYNGESLRVSYKELMEAAHKVDEVTVFELSPTDKKKFDEYFPFIKGQYPRIITRIIPLDTERYQVLPQFSGILVKYDVCFDKEPVWEYKNRSYWVVPSVNIFSQKIDFEVYNTKSPLSMPVSDFEWYQFSSLWPEDSISALEDAFSKFQGCPTIEALGAIWLPFTKQDISLYPIWQMWRDAQQSKKFTINMYAFPTIMPITPDLFFNGRCSYHGVVAGQLFASSLNASFDAIFFLESPWRPAVDIGRSVLLNVPLEIYATICGILATLDFNDDFDKIYFDFFRQRGKFWTLSEWRKLITSSLGDWLKQTLEDRLLKIKHGLQEGQDLEELFALGQNRFDHLKTVKQFWNWYLISYFQNTYDMTISYTKKQVVTFYDKTQVDIETSYDLFPPMMFCKAATEQDRRYLCSSNSQSRYAITADHPFTIWLLNNVELLNLYCPQYFRTIVECLCEYDAKSMIQRFCNLREHLMTLPKKYGIHMDAFPKLDISDFWDEEETISI